MGLRTKIAFGVTGLMTLVAAACSKGQVGPVVTPAQEAAVTPPAATAQAPHDLTPEAYGLIPTSGSEMVTDYLAKTELNALELGALNRVLNEMQTVPAERISSDAWSFNYIVIGDRFDTFGALQPTTIGIMDIGRGGLTPTVRGTVI